MKNAAKRIFSCKNRSRYSRKRATFCRNFANRRSLTSPPPYSPFATIEDRNQSLFFETVPSAEDRMPFRLRVRTREGSEMANFENFFENFANFWRARSRLYQNEILQENMRSTAFFKLYMICILLHRCNLKMFAKNLFEKLRISQNF